MTGAMVDDCHMCPGGDSGRTVSPSLAFVPLQDVPPRMVKPALTLGTSHAGDEVIGSHGMFPDGICETLSMAMVVTVP